MQMTNREKLIKTGVYDLLCLMQERVCNDDAISGLCIVENIEGKPLPCPEGCSLGHGCRECIEKWLDKEARWQ